MISTEKAIVVHESFFIFCLEINVFTVINNYLFIIPFFRSSHNLAYSYGLINEN